jgi:hypothetical protein
MDLLARSRATPASEREMQFSRQRDQIERIASEIFDKQKLYPIRVLRSISVLPTEQTTNKGATKRSADSLPNLK